MSYEIRFGSIPEDYTDRDGNKQTSWSPSGHKLLIDWEARKTFMVDARTEKTINFSAKKKDEARS